MGALFPLYLAGALAIAIPIYLHLRRRPPKDAIDFSSLMFLQPTKHQPIKRKSQLENIPLLLLRCLALLLLAAMFSRPFMRGGDKTGAEGRMRTVVLLDTSASMRRDGVWDAAKRAAEDAIAKIRPDGALAIIAVDAAPRTVAGFDDWESSEASQRSEIASNAIATLEPGWMGSDLGAGLIAAAEMIADASADDEAVRPAEVVVVSDLQAGAALDAVADASWPPNLNVTLVPLGAKNPTNVTIAAAATLDPKLPAVRVRNDPASEQSEFEIRAGGTMVTAVVPPGESRVIQLAEAASEVTITGDGNDFDNRLFLAPREPASVALQFMGAGKPDDSNLPEYYFRRALAASEVLVPRFVDDLAEEPSILAIGRELDAGERAAVRRFLDAGGRALILVGSAGMEQTLAELAGMKGAGLTEHDGRYALLEEVDFDHPSLREFRDPRWRDFTEVHFWKFRVLDPAALPEGAEVVARFDTGDPAWVEVPAGKGSLFVMLSGWHPRDSQLSLSSKFVPLLFSIFADVGPQVGGVRQFFVGEPLPLEVDETRLTLPSGDGRDLAPDEVFRPEEPGIYRVSDGGRERAFAVNLRPSESELTTLGPEPLAALGVPMARDATGPEVLAGDDKRLLRDRENEATQNLWRWAVVILLAMLVIESWIATRTGRSAMQPEPAAS